MSFCIVDNQNVYVNSQPELSSSQKGKIHSFTASKFSQNTERAFKIFCVVALTIIAIALCLLVLMRPFVSIPGPMGPAGPIGPMGPMGPGWI